MKLYGSLTSPFVRKCRITALEAGVDDRLEFVNTAIMDPNAEHPNPLNLVPSFQSDTGDLIVDSPLICDFVRSLGDQSEHNDWADRTLVALADGLADRAVSITLESRRPAHEQSPTWIVRWTDVILATLTELEPRTPGTFTPGAIALTCALGYLDFRHANIDWRNGHDSLSSWYDAQLTRPSVVATEHPR
jgi:glutathione S-transferase